MLETCLLETTKMPLPLSAADTLESIASRANVNCFGAPRIAPVRGSVESSHNCWVKVSVREIQRRNRTRPSGSAQADDMTKLFSEAITRPVSASADSKL